VTVVLVPSYPLGFLDGLPADHIGDFLAAILLAAFILPRDYSRPSVGQLLGLIALVLVSAGLRWASCWAEGPEGLTARYESEWPPGRLELERSTSWSLPQASRIDRCLDFQGIGTGFGRHPLWTDFLNTLRPLTARIEDRLNRRLNVVWSGYVQPDRDCTLSVAASCPCDLQVGATGMLHAGNVYPIRLEARFPNVRHPWLQLRTADDAQVVPARWLFPAEPGRRFPWLAISLVIAAWLVVAAILGLIGRVQLFRLAVWEVGGRCLLVFAALGTGAVLWEISLARDLAFALLPPDDGLHYADEARTLFFNGLLTDDGVAFHRSPFMRYYLLVGHALFGESTYGVILFQQVLRGVTALLTLHLTQILTRQRGAGWLAAIITLCLPNPITLSLYYWPETLGTVLFLVVCIGLVGWVQRPSVRRGVGVGLTVGVLALVRTNSIGLIPPLFLGMLLRKRGRAGAAVFLVSAGAVLGLVPLRNYLVTHHGEPFATQGPVNLVLGNNIPRDTDITFALTGEPAHDRWLRRAMEHLYDFENNPAAVFDVFPPESNARMGPALTRVWLAYVVQHPGHYLGQVLGRAWSWFFSGWHIVTVLSLFAVAGIGCCARGEDCLAWWTLVGATVAQSLPFWLAYFEPRHRAVVLPELVVLAVLGGLTVWRWAGRCRQGGSLQIAALRIGGGTPGRRG
jgi:hypothetical protein